MKNGSFYIELLQILFGQVLEKIELLFTLTSGHTGLHLPSWGPGFNSLAHHQCSVFTIVC